MRFRFSVLVLFVGGSAFAGPDEFFEMKIRPVLVDKCWSCHSDQAGKSKGSLKLDSRAALMAGGESGPTVVVGKPAESSLMKAIRRTDDQVSAMPPTEPGLTVEQVKDFETWIRDGAVFPGNAKPKADPRDHWAFQPIGKPQPPPVEDAGWWRTPSDRFLWAKMQAAKLTPAGDAAPEIIARRLSVTLVGLPPTLADLDRFLIEFGKSPDSAIANYADRLLASPHFGERWARHWMDVIRYADAGGHEYDYDIEGAWRYRDYLVRAFNADLPYDRFVREHLAGDLMPPRIVDGRNEALAATAWWNLGEAPTAPVDLLNDEGERMDARLDVLGKAFSGLTVACARCHDHKFDPISTKEYYGLFGIAAGTPSRRAWVNGPALDGFAEKLQALRDEAAAELPQPDAVAAVPLNLDAARMKLLGDFALGLPAGWALSGAAEQVTPETAGLRGRHPGLWSGTLSRRLPADVRSRQFLVDSEFLDVLAAGKDAAVLVVVGNYQAIRDPIYDRLKMSLNSEEFKWHRIPVGRWKGRRMHLEITTGHVDGSHQILRTVDKPTSVFGIRAVVATDGAAPPAIKFPKLGTPSWPAETAKRWTEIEKSIPLPERIHAVFDGAGKDLPIHARGDATKPKGEPIPRLPIAVWRSTSKETQPRLRLADAITSDANPLFDRVIVNRLWHHVFSRGLVPTVDNFGILGEAPSHPELLDELALRFRTIHNRSIKTMLKELVTAHAFRTASGAAPVSDATNVLLSRYPLRRLDAETLRDSILAAAGTLDRTLGGPTIAVPHRLADAGSDSGNNTPASGPIDGKRRRSLYLDVRRNLPNPFLEIFDRPTPQAPVGRRDVTTSPSQALTLLNDPFVVAQAKIWGDRMKTDADATDGKLTRMMRACFARSPTAAELDALNTAVQTHGWDHAALVLFNAKEFLYVP